MVDSSRILEHSDLEPHPRAATTKPQYQSMSWLDGGTINGFFRQQLTAVLWLLSPFPNPAAFALPADRVPTVVLAAISPHSNICIPSELIAESLQSRARNQRTYRSAQCVSLLSTPTTSTGGISRALTSIPLFPPSHLSCSKPLALCSRSVCSAV